MINYNVYINPEYLKMHPLNHKYGRTIVGGIYFQYALTIVDNISNKRFIKCLLHLNERVRRYTELELGIDFLYLCFNKHSTNNYYQIYPYYKTQLSKERIIEDLLYTFYILEPNLIENTLAATDDIIEHDRNLYEGRYVLNDEEEYTILKELDTIKFYKGKVSNWNETNNLIYQEKINFDVYKLSLKVLDKKYYITKNINELLDKNTKKDFEEYYALKEELFQKYNKYIKK